MKRSTKWWGWGANDKSAHLEQMPEFMEFAEKNTDLRRNFRGLEVIDFAAIELSSVRESPEFIHKLSEFLSAEQITSDKLERLVHTYGKSYRDLLRFRLNKQHTAPDYIIFPNSHEQVERIVHLANLYQVVIIPFGGGTNIVGAVERLPQEQRTVISLDLTRMNRLLDLDPISMTATFEAGVLGPELEALLAEKGFSLGHYPDSFEYSTLGGWIATRSAGMQSDRYGPIANMVLSLQVVTPQGSICTKTVPNASVGPDLKQLFMGCEGQYAIITAATMKIHSIAAKRVFRGVLFHNFADGVELIRQCATQGCLPHTIRFIDSRETQLSFSLKTPKSRMEEWFGRAVKIYLKRMAGFDLRSCCLMILIFEGTKAEVVRQQKQVLELCRHYQGIDLGARPGEQWFARKYDYPYLRDLIMDFGGMVDVVETATLWSNVNALYVGVTHAIYQAFAAMKQQSAWDASHLPGYVGCHISHSYENGACLYFTFAQKPIAGKELECYLAIKKAALDAIIQYGGALSHHHSIGYEHQPWLEAEIGVAGITSLVGIKQALDPQNILNPGKFIPSVLKTNRH